MVRGIGLINDLEELRNIVVKNINGTPVLVRHLADVHESCLPRLGQVGRMDEDDVVQGIVVMRKGENPGEVIDALKTKIEDINKNILPKDVEIVPFYDRENLVNLAVRTVTHNLIEGILLVTFIVLIFMADWRTTVVVAVVIPLALLFAFICLRAMGMSANLLSMGAIDFGIIIDGAVVMVEGVFVALDKKAREVGMPAFNRMSKMGLIRHTAKDKAKAVFFSKLIIITALIPIFSFQKVEGKMFSPLAYTLGFALLGALLFTLTLVLLSETADTVPRDENGVYAVPKEQILSESRSVYGGVTELFPFLEFPDTGVKAVRCSRIMSVMGFTGVYFACVGESNVNVDSPACLLPSTIAHELAHQRGVAWEQECNFLGVLASVTSGMPDYIYSGWLLGFIHLGNALYETDPEAYWAIRGTLPAAVEADLRDNSAYWDQFRDNVVEKVSDTVYDAALKSYGDANGMKSYSMVVELLVAYYKDLI